MQAWRWTLLASSLLLASLGGGTAHAVPISRRFCFSYQSDLVDASPSNGDDFITADGLFAAKHALVNIWNDTGGFPIQNNHLDANGCTPVLTVESTHQYTATLYSSATLPGSRKVRVQRNRCDETLFARQVTITSFGKFDVQVVADATGFQNSWVNLMLVATHTILRKKAAWPADSNDYIMHLEDNRENGDGQVDYRTPMAEDADPYSAIIHPDCTTNPDQEYLETAGATYDTALSGNAARRKFTIAHEMGHLLQIKKMCHRDGGGTCTPSLTAYTIKTRFEWQPGDTPSTACLSPSGAGNADHFYNSTEYQAAAASEGWAHYVAAFAFNNPANVARFKPNSPVQWNYLTGGANGESDDPFSVQGAELGGDYGGAEWTDPPTRVQGRDLYGQFCLADGAANRGTEMDWMRFWWDFNLAPNRGFKKAAQVLSAMDGDTWCPDDSGCGDPFSYPSARLLDAMNTLGHGGLYNQIRDNGVDR